MVACRDAWWTAAIAGASVGRASRTLTGGAGGVSRAAGRANALGSSAVALPVSVFMASCSDAVRAGTSVLATGHKQLAGRQGALKSAVVKEKAGRAASPDGPPGRTVTLSWVPSRRVSRTRSARWSPSKSARARTVECGRPEPGRRGTGRRRPVVESPFAVPLSRAGRLPATTRSRFPSWSTSPAARVGIPPVPVRILPGRPPTESRPSVSAVTEVTARAPLVKRPKTVA